MANENIIETINYYGATYKPRLDENLNLLIPCFCWDKEVGKNIIYNMRIDRQLILDMIKGDK